MNGVHVEINNKSKKDYPVPYGFSYKAKGAYRQGKYIIVVGVLKKTFENTIRIKYPYEDVTIKLI